MNVHRFDTGRQVTALATSHRAFGSDFPGWAADDAADYLRPIPEGQAGTVSYVESHGSNPWTRYSVRFTNGTHASGLVHGQDFTFADGRPQTTA